MVNATRRQRGLVIDPFKSLPESPFDYQSDISGTRGSGNVIKARVGVMLSVVIDTVLSLSAGQV